ncbi:hypothetical protein JT55_07740 [Rhodovulum sp. NI22]|nr:hypothetical protein JT55_07740 [Rhodovulum sp. NI22]
MQATQMNTTATVVETREITKGIRLLRFAIAGDPISVEAGAHVTFALPHDGQLIHRSYSVVDDGQRPDMLTVAVKLEPASKGGSAAMWRLSVGDQIQLTGNDNSMPVSYGAQTYVVVAGGIGITPMTGVARTLRKTGKSVTMHYCARAPEEAAFVDLMQDLLGDDLTLHYASEGATLDVKALVAALDRATILYMCGPMGLTEAIKSAWAEHGLPSQNLRYETFGNSGTRPTRPFTVHVEESARTVEVGAGQTLLDALLESGHQVLSDCRKGECGLCKVVVHAADAEIDHRDVFLSDRERAAANCLCSCVSRLPGGHMTIRIDGIPHGRSD